MPKPSPTRWRPRHTEHPKGEVAPVELHKPDLGVSVAMMILIASLLLLFFFARGDFAIP